MKTRNAISLAVLLMGLPVLNASADDLSPCALAINQFKHLGVSKKSIMQAMRVQAMYTDQDLAARGMHMLAATFEQAQLLDSPADAPIAFDAFFRINDPELGINLKAEQSQAIFEMAEKFGLPSPEQAADVGVIDYVHPQIGLAFLGTMDSSVADFGSASYKVAKSALFDLPAHVAKREWFFRFAGTLRAKGVPAGLAQFLDELATYVEFASEPLIALDGYYKCGVMARLHLEDGPLGLVVDAEGAASLSTTLLNDFAMEGPGAPVGAARFVESGALILDGQVDDEVVEVMGEQIYEGFASHAYLYTNGDASPGTQSFCAQHSVEVIENYLVPTIGPPSGG